jgi:hypothetical protein
MNLKEIERAMEELGITLVEAIEADRSTAALVVLYSGIDILSSLTRPESSENTSSQYFKEWVERYMLLKLPSALTAQDIWSARCGLLHTNQPDSDLSRKGKAKEIVYMRAPMEDIESAQKLCDADTSNVSQSVVVAFSDLHQAFFEGVSNFFADINRDMELQRRATFHSKKMFGQTKFK